MIRKILTTGMVLLSCLFITCTTKQDISLNLDGSGSIDLKVVLAPVFINYLYDLAEATTEIKSKAELVIFNTRELKTALEKEPGIAVEQILSKSQDSLELKLRCKDLKSLGNALSPSAKQRLISFTETGGTKEFRFFLDKKNYQDIKKLFPLLKEALFENLEPQVNENVTKAEYLDIVEFAMDKAGREAVLAAFVDVKIKVQGQIVSSQGGIIKDGAITLKIPLIDVLLLNTPVEFSVKFK